MSRLATLLAEGSRPVVTAEFPSIDGGGLAAVDRLFDRLRLGPGQRLLDVCSGMGGPARYLALWWQRPCSWISKLCRPWLEIAAFGCESPRTRWARTSFSS